MKYKCNKCNKEFNQKGHYDAHINKKYPCVVNNDEENKIITELSKGYHMFIPELSQNYHNINHDLLQENNETLYTPNIANTNNTNNINVLSDNKSDNKLSCRYCNKIFTAKSNLSRHKKSRCKTKNSAMDQNNSVNLMLEQSEQIIDELSKIREENKTLKNELVELKQQQEKQLAVVSKSKNSKINNSHNNTNTNTNNTNNVHDNTITNNTNSNNIIFNGPVNFGDEDISKIGKLDMLFAIKTLTDCFPNFVKVINLNANHPENQNILFNNMQNDIGTIIEDNKLVVKTKTEIISEVISTRLPNLPGFKEA